MDKANEIAVPMGTSRIETCASNGEQAPPATEGSLLQGVTVGGRYRFNYPQQFTSLPEYSAHRGQAVTVLRALVDGVDYDYEGDPMFEVQADDGWLGDAWASELEKHDG